MSITIYQSRRNHQLIYNEPPCDRPVVTVENHSKWYGIQVVRTDGCVVEIDFTEVMNEMPGDFEGTAVLDHVVNPKAFQLFAEQRGWYYCEQSYEMVIGRWEQEGPNASTTQY